MKFARWHEKRGLGMAGILCAALLAFPGPAAAEEPLPEEVLKEQVYNLIGEPSMDPIPIKVLKEPGGQERLIDGRIYLTRHATVATPLTLILGWRVGGSQMNEWVGGVRTSATVPPGEISENPSYREIMHAMVIDRINSGKFASGTISSQSDIDREKLIVSSLQLMLLRDYYELLERTALTLALQVAMMVETVEMQSSQGVRKMP